MPPGALLRCHPVRSQLKKISVAQRTEQNSESMTDENTTPGHSTSASILVSRGKLDLTNLRTQMAIEKQALATMQAQLQSEASARYRQAQPLEYESIQREIESKFQTASKRLVEKISELEGVIQNKLEAIHQDSWIGLKVRLEHNKVIRKVILREGLVSYTEAYEYIVGLYEIDCNSEKLILFQSMEDGSEEVVGSQDEWTDFLERLIAQEKTLLSVRVVPSRRGQKRKQRSEDANNMGSWNEEEVILFGEAVNVHGWGRWKEISEEFPRRNHQQIKDFSQTKIAQRFKPHSVSVDIIAVKGLADSAAGLKSFMRQSKIRRTTVVDDEDKLDATEEEEDYVNDEDY